MRVDRMATCLALVALGVAVPAALGPCATALAGPAAAQLQLTRSAPEADARLASAPAEVRLWFSARPELAVSMIRLAGPDGAIAVGELQAGTRNDLAAALPAGLGEGDYTVTWRTSSGDGNPIRGSFGFTVTGR